MAGFYNYGYPYTGQQAPQYMQTAQPNMQNTQQIQNGGFVSVRSKQEALMWPIAPGSSITFKDETAPYVYTKTMGFSQLDRPQFETYRLIKEEPPEAPQTPTEQRKDDPVGKGADYALKSDLEVLINAYDKLQKELEALKNEFNQPIIQEVDEDERSVR